MSAPSLVQQFVASTGASGQSSRAAVSGSSVTAGNLVLVFIRHATGVNFSSITSARGAVYTLVRSITSHDPHLLCYAGVPTSSGTETVTVTLSGSSQFFWVKCLEYSGCGSMAPVGIAVSATPTGTTNITVGSITTTNAAELIVLAVSQANFATYSAGTDFTLIDGTINDGAGNNFGGIESYAPGTTLSGYTAHITSTVTDDSSVIAVALTGATRNLMGAWFYPITVASNPEGLRITRSDDGKTWYDAYPNCTYTPTNGFNACRNPALRKVSSTYWIMHADSAESQSYLNDQAHIAIASSSDGVAWTPTYRPSFASVGSFTATPRIWAGHWFIDVDSSEHYVFAAETNQGVSGFKLWEIHPVTPGDFSAWSTPVQITGTAIPVDSIDPQIIYNGGTYYLIFSKGSYLTDASPAVATSSSPFSGYDTEIHSGNWNGLNASSAKNDQPEIYTINGTDTMYTDQYAIGGVTYTQQQSGDWKNGGATTWSSIATAVGVPDYLTATLRAGTILDQTPVTLVPGVLPYFKQIAGF